MKPSDPPKDTPLRIVIGADTYAPDINGAAVFARHLALGLAAGGHDVHVVCPSPSGRSYTETDEGTTVHRMASLPIVFHPTMRWSDPLRGRPAAERLLAEIAPDVVHVHAHVFVGEQLIHAARKLGIPVVATNHLIPENLVGYQPLPDWIKDQVSRVVWRQLVSVYARADVITAPTQRAVDLLGIHGLDRRAYAVSCGIDLAAYHAAPVHPTNPVPTVLFVGRLDEEKHIDELVRAVALCPGPLRAQIVGQGNQREALEQLARELGVAERVEFLGFVPDAEVLAAYQRADIFCMPSIAELQSIVTLEAMACGLPVVAADALALPHLVHPGRNGYLYAPGDVHTLAAHLSMLAADIELREAMGQAGREIAQTHDLADTLRIFAAVYRDLVDRRAAGLDSRDLPDGFLDHLVDTRTPAPADDDARLAGHVRAPATPEALATGEIPAAPQDPLADRLPDGPAAGGPTRGTGGAEGPVTPASAG